MERDGLEDDRRLRGREELARKKNDLEDLAMKEENLRSVTEATRQVSQGDGGGGTDDLVVAHTGTALFQHLIVEQENI